MSNTFNSSKQDYLLEIKTTSFTVRLEWIAADRCLFRLTKRLFDIILSALALLLTGPLILIGAVAVKLTSPGPMFYYAKRAGLGGKPFYMYKLRTMYINTDTLDRRVTAAHDDRITPVGRLLRKLKIDEFPQFWNVLLGDMSIVGPRPEDMSIVQQYYTPEQRRTLDVQPGIASLAEVSWYPDLTYHDPPPPGVPIQEWYLERHLPAQLAASLNYVDQESIFLYWKLIGQTAFCLLVYSWLPPKKRPLSPVREHNSASLNVT